MKWVKMLNGDKKKRKLFEVIFIAIAACFSFVGCADTIKQPPTTGSDSSISSPEQPSEPDTPDQEEITKMFITINGNKIEVTLAENSSVDALVDILKKSDIVYTATDYGDFEKVGSLGHTLPTNNSQITTRAGDVMLYSGNQIVLFYGSNSWSYTRLGKINGYSVSELRSLLGAGTGSVQVTVSLH